MGASMQDYLDLERYPVDRPDSAAHAALCERCRADLSATGMFTLVGFLRPDAARAAARALTPALETDAFTHRRRHNIYFTSRPPGLPPGHPALTEFETVNHTLCADQIGAPVKDIYEWPPLAAFLARVMGKPALHPMADPLARVNVMRYGAGEALNWHFDRSEFTTTLLLQAPDAGGAFEYRTDLRAPDDPNHDGVARLLQGADPEVRRIDLSPGALNVFRGVNTAHRVTPVIGDTSRIIAVFSYFDRPGVCLSTDERVGFYGRAS